MPWSICGKTLDQFIGREGLGHRQATKWAIQIAAALAAAHSKGIVHRDVKPGNVMVNQQGHLKVLDFGLSKLVDAVPSGELSATATYVQQPRTEEGTLVGTVDYMSPEQAESRPVDARSDIFSFGALLYEMATGRRPFGSDSKISILAGILREEPAAVSSVAMSSEGRGALLSAYGRRADRSGGFAGRIRIGRARPTLTRLTHDSGLTADAALSPDGRLVAYPSDRAGEGSLDIWVRQLAGGSDAHHQSARRRVRTEFLAGRNRHCVPVGRGRRWDLQHLGARRPATAGGRGGPRTALLAGRQTDCILEGQPHRRHAVCKGRGQYLGGAFRRRAGPADRAGLRSCGKTGVDSRRQVSCLLWTTKSRGYLAARCLGSSCLGWAELRHRLPRSIFKQNLRLTASYPLLARDSSDRYYISLTNGDVENLWRFTLTPTDWRVADMRRVTSGTQSEVQASVGGDHVVFTAEDDSIQVWSVSVDADLAQVQAAPEQVTHGDSSGLPVVSSDGKKLLYASRCPGEQRAILRDLVPAPRPR